MNRLVAQPLFVPQSSQRSLSVFATARTSVISHRPTHTPHAPGATTSTLMAQHQVAVRGPLHAAPSSVARQQGHGWISIMAR